MSGLDVSWSGLLEQPYDHYFSSRHYEERYPRPNPGTLRFLRAHGVDQARRVLDIGCGNGRYAIPLLPGLAGELVGCDISGAALEAFEARLAGHPQRARVSLVRGEVAQLPPGPAFDRIAMLFGVLSHVGPRAARVETLRQVRARCSADALLLLSVPSIWRRMPLRLARSLLERRDAWGDVAYERQIAGTAQPFRYHLYGVRDLRRELRLGGWELAHVEPESVLPEAFVCRSPGRARFDAALQLAMPAFLAYGMRAVARPLPYGEPFDPSTPDDRRSS